MPELRNERVYLSKTKSEDFIQELLAAYEMADGKRIVIYDDRNKLDDYIDVYISAYKSDENSNKIFEMNKWFNLVKLFMDGCALIQIGIWKNERELYKKIVEELRVVEEEAYGEQIELKVILVNDTTEKWIEENFKSDEGVAFFNFTIFSKVEPGKFVFNSAHFGTEYHMECFERKRLEQLLQCIDGDYFFVRLSDCYVNG